MFSIKMVSSKYDLSPYLLLCIKNAHLFKGANNGRNTSHFTLKPQKKHHIHGRSTDFASSSPAPSQNPIKFYLNKIQVVYAALSASRLLGQSELFTQFPIKHQMHRNALFDCTSILYQYSFLYKIKTRLSI